MTGTSQRYIKYLAAGVIAFAVGGLGALGVAMGSTPQTAPPPLACTGQIDPVAGGTLRCVPAGPTTSPKPTPSASTTTAAPTPASTTPAPTTSTPKPSPSSPQPTTTTPSNPGGQQVRAWMTGYSGAGDDNSCGGHGGNCIAFPVSDGYPTEHDVAGGTGTYDDPVTVAVAEDELRKYPPGTRFYLPYLRVYGVSEDYCGNDDNPECSEKPNHLDVWTGENGSDACMNRVTGAHAVIVNPGRGYAVALGPIDERGCNVFSDAVMLA